LKHYLLFLADRQTHGHKAIASPLVCICVRGNDSGWLSWQMADSLFQKLHSSWKFVFKVVILIFRKSG